MSCLSIREWNTKRGKAKDNEKGKGKGYKREYRDREIMRRRRQKVELIIEFFVTFYISTPMLSSKSHFYLVCNFD